MADPQAQRAESRLSWIDRLTGTLIRRYERSAPVGLVDLDVRNVGKIPSGVAGMPNDQHSLRRCRHLGYTYPHVEIDGYDRGACVEAYGH